MIVKKILNNNLVLALDQNEREHIIIGKGIGFTNTVGKELRSVLWGRLEELIQSVKVE